MTQTKLEIIGPYTPDHEGPYVYIIDGFLEPEMCKVLFSTSIVALVETEGFHKPFALDVSNIRNAREVPVAREFWINEFRDGCGKICHTENHEKQSDAYKEKAELPDWDWVRTIHVREVLPGEGA